MNFLRLLARPQVPEVRDRLWLPPAPEIRRRQLRRLRQSPRSSLERLVDQSNLPDPRVPVLPLNRRVPQVPVPPLPRPAPQVPLPPLHRPVLQVPAAPAVLAVPEVPAAPGRLDLPHSANPALGLRPRCYS